MNTKSVIGVVLAFGVAFSLLAGSGVGAAVFDQTPEDAQTSRTLEDIGEQSGVDKEDGEGLSADVGGDNEPTVIGVGISGGEFLVTLIGAIAVVPYTLVRLGFPVWFAVPLGSVGQVIGLIGLVQFVRTGEFL
jgi:hypothetical protein